MSEKQFPCGKCGAKVTFSPGKAALTCPYCAHSNEIPQSEDDIVELDFRAHLAKLEATEETVEQHTVKCRTCGGETTLDPNVTAGACVFCDSDIVATAKSTKALKPESLLPFKVEETDARNLFRTWVSGLWFAPNKIKRYAQIDAGLTGIYVPYWTYDSNTTSWYRGERGDAYYVSKTYTTVVNGKPVTRTRQVRRIRWSSVSGVVWRNFDDVLVLASESLPRKYTLELEPWDLENLVGYQDDYLSGFRSESYQLGLTDGFEDAQKQMDGAIHTDVRRDIGGDEQRVHSVRTRHADVTFKHILLPIWISAYRYRDQVYRFLVNARTGEVQGERPWSVVKITLAVVTVLVVIAGTLFFVNR